MKNWSSIFKSWLSIFLLCFLLAFGGGYAFYETGEEESAATREAVERDQTSADVDSKAAESTSPQQAAQTVQEGQILAKRGCIACHAVSSLGISGGATGPDLSKAYVQVKEKHGVSMEEFLKKPTSAVMAGVLGDKPLTDEERKAVIEALKKASEK